MSVVCRFVVGRFRVVRPRVGFVVVLGGGMGFVVVRWGLLRGAGLGGGSLSELPSLSLLAALPLLPLPLLPVQVVVDLLRLRRGRGGRGCGHVTARDGLPASLAFVFWGLMIW